MLKTRTNQKGITNHLVNIVTALLVISLIGFAGFRVYVSNNVKAKAESTTWTTRSFANANVKMTDYVCKTKTLADGGGWIVTAKTKNEGTASYPYNYYSNLTDNTGVNPSSSTANGRGLYSWYVSNLAQNQSTPTVYLQVKNAAYLYVGNYAAGLSGTRLAMIVDCTNPPVATK